MQDIHDIRPPVQVGFDPILLNVIFMILGGILLCALLFFLVRKYLKKKKQIRDPKYLLPPIAPYAAALRKLDLLFQDPFDPRLFYFDLAAVLRQYIGSSFAIHAPEMTSQELLRSLNDLEFDRGVKKEISKFLKRSDPFKYAGIVPEKDQAKADLLFVKEQIGQIEKSLIKEEETP